MATTTHRGGNHSRWPCSNKSRSTQPRMHGGKAQTSNKSLVNLPEDLYSMRTYHRLQVMAVGNAVDEGAGNAVGEAMAVSLA